MALNDDQELYSEINNKKPIDQINQDLVDITTVNYNIKFISNPAIINVDKTNEMRLDKICYMLYRRTDYVHQMMKLNGIINPFSIRSGDQLQWSAFNELEESMPVIDEQQDVRNKLVEEFKKSQIDPIRITFLKAKAQNTQNILERKKIENQIKELEQQQTQLPPTITNEGFEQVVFEDGNIVITPSISSISPSQNISQQVTNEQAAKIRNTDRNAIKNAQNKSKTDSETIPFQLNQNGLNPAKNNNRLNQKIENTTTSTNKATPNIALGTIFRNLKQSNK